ncbi:MAG TPA: hypothetical protein VI113_03520 [Alphaproteobacteria bacterium]
MAKISPKSIFLLGLALILTLSACAYQPPPATSGDEPGLLMGLVHGLVAPLALIAGIFTHVRVYAFPNSGWWYDLGFLIGLSAWGGGTRYVYVNRRYWVR